MKPALLLLAAAALLGGAGCDLRDMYKDAKERPLAKSTFFPDGRNSRPLVEDTVARGHLKTDELLSTGRINGLVSDEFPFPVTRQVLDRGQQRYDIFCSPCHGRVGDGGGMIVQRGFKRPPSFHADRLRQAPAGHFFDVMTNGFGAMYPYRDRVSVQDRWAIAGYIRALQLSQNASINDVPDAERSQLEAEKP